VLCIILSSFDKCVQNVHRVIVLVLCAIGTIYIVIKNALISSYTYSSFAYVHMHMCAHAHTPSFSWFTFLTGISFTSPFYIMFLFYCNFLFIVCSVIERYFCSHHCGFPRRSPYHLLKNRLQKRVLSSFCS
jgi:hypothetical protein